MKRSNYRLLLIAAIASVAATPAAWADPFLTVELVARKYGSTDAYSNTISVANTTDTWEYAIWATLSDAGATNSYPTYPIFQTIQMWQWSSEAFSPTGLNSLAFSIVRSSTPDAIATDMLTKTTAQTTGDVTWDAGTGARNGQLVMRSDGSGHDLNNIVLIGPAGKFAGIDVSASPVPLKVATGRFGINNLGAATELNFAFPNLIGLNLLGGMRWLNAQNGEDMNYAPLFTEQSASVAGGDPIIKYIPLHINADVVLQFPSIPAGGVNIGSMVAGTGTTPATTFVIDRTGAAPAVVTVTNNAPGTIVSDKITAQQVSTTLSVTVSLDAAAAGTAGSKFGSLTVHNDSNTTDPDQVINFSAKVYLPIAPEFSSGVLANVDSGELQASAMVTTAGSSSNPHFAVSGLAAGTIIPAGGSTGEVTFVNDNALNGTHKTRIQVGVGYADSTILGAAGPRTLSNNITATVEGNLAPNTRGAAFDTPQSAYIFQGNTLTGYWIGDGLVGFREIVRFLDSTPLTRNSEVNVAWRLPFTSATASTLPGWHVDESRLRTDVIRVNGVPADATYVFELIVPLMLQRGVYDELLDESTFLGRLSAGPDGIPNTPDDAWQRIVSGSPVMRAYQPGDMDVIGRWGIDMSFSSVWAVLPGTTQGEFALAPEPGSMALFALAAVPLLVRRRRS